MAKKKKRAAPRRTPYERSLEHATVRLENALCEQRNYQLRLAALNQEIPYLQQIIAALTPPTLSDIDARAISSVPPPTDDELPGVPEHLKRFLPKTVGRTLKRVVTPTINTPGPVAPNPEADDAFLPEPEGKEVLET